jgi:hypothetical protein
MNNPQSNQRLCPKYTRNSLRIQFGAVERLSYPLFMDPVILEILAQLVRGGLFGEDDIAEIAARVEAAGRTDDAHNIRAAWLEGLAAPLPVPESSQVTARRSYMHVVPDGGNAET